MNELFHLKIQKLNSYYIKIFIAVSVVIFLSLSWNIYNESEHHKNSALEHAKNSFVKDLMLRKWVSSHGGVYVFPTKRTPPNPYLSHIENRDLTTTDGQKLTLMNPAYTLRQLMNEFEGMYGAKGYITSLNLLNPNNKASEWETKALKIFEKKDQLDFHEFVQEENQEYIYYMHALITKESCLRCHADQGYEVGDVRGGVSVIIPMKKYNDDFNSAVKKIVIVYIIFYIMAIFGLYYTYKTLKKSILEQEKLYIENQKKEEIMLAQSRNAAMGEMISMIAHQWRQPISVIAMWVNNITVDVDMGELNEEDCKKYASNIVAQTQHLSQTIDDFKNFFRPDKSKEHILIKDVMEECLAVIEKSLQNHNIKIEKNYENSTEVEIYSRELMQVFINIIKNAKEALLEHKIKNATIVIDIYEDNGSVIVKIQDNALGIDSEVMKKIFDPYFTTKSVKSGTGLGLYMSKTIVEKHLNGTIDANNLEDGVCFKIIIPKELK
ncbi:MAG: DUF3365 domain-containing protein [Campylobacterota bacterium]|nr:DUF3365 domain-containing protein [Campylobacterota bacterium]